MNFRGSVNKRPAKKGAKPITDKCHTPFWKKNIVIDNSSTTDEYLGIRQGTQIFPNILTAIQIN